MELRLPVVARENDRRPLRGRGWHLTASTAAVERGRWRRYTVLDGVEPGYDWFRQSQDDLLWARDTLRAGRYAQTCFAAQQVGEKAIESLRSLPRGRVTAAYLYGSFARGDLSPDSDIDCILVAETDVPFTMRGRLFDDLRDRLPSVEALVYTPEELARLTTDPSPGFWQSVTRDLLRIL